MSDKEKIAKKVPFEEGVIFTFIDGTEFVAILDDLPTDIVRRLAIHGMNQKLGDSYAKKEISVSEALAGVIDLYGQLQSGVWANRASGGKLAIAISRALGESLPDVIRSLAGKSKDEKAEYRKHPQIILELAKMKQEEAESEIAATEGKEIPQLQL